MPPFPKFDIKPPAEGGNPYAPPGPGPLVFEQFEGINTSTSRYGVDDKQAYWMDGWMPIGPKQLRTMPDIGAAIYTAVGKTVVLFRFANIGPTFYAIVFLSDGSVVAVNVVTSAATTLLAAGTISAPAVYGCDVTQWAQQYVILVANQPNGYWLWDGNNIYTAGTLAPLVTITASGSGYVNPPLVLISGGTGSGAEILAQISGGVVTGAVVALPGSNYLAGQTVTLTFSGGNSGGSSAAITASLSHSAGGTGGAISLTWVYQPRGAINYWYLSSATVLTGGTGYSPFTFVNISGTGGGFVIPATLSVTISAGVITAVTVTNSGLWNAETGNTYNPNTYVTNAVVDNGGYYVSGTTISNGGTGYTPGTTITASGGGSPVSQASFSPVITAGVITAVTILSGGLYGSNTPPTLTVANPVANATGTVTLMPFAVQGTTAETYQGRVWVAAENELIFSAPGSFSDFATSDGGGDTASGDSFLRVTYVRLVNSNGFLYLIADSSINYISSVQTASTPPTTTFTNQNADPGTGSPWPASVETWGRNIVFGNAYGIHVCYGAETVKISEALDGFYPTGNFSSEPSSARSVVFGKKLWMMLLNVTDLVTGQAVNKLLIWNGKFWWTSEQGVTLTFIATMEQNSVPIAYGTDGTSIYPLFQVPSANFTKTTQSKLWSEPGGYQFVKAAVRLWSILFNDEVASATVTYEIDSDNADSATYAATVPQGLCLLPPQAIGQWGTLQGLTITTTAPQVDLWTAMMQPEIVQYKG